MNKWTLAAGLGAAALLQAYLVSAIGGGQVVPNLLLLILLTVAVTRSFKFALTMALWTGLWLDIANGHYFGLQMFLFSLFVLAVSWLKKAGLEFDRRLTVLPLLVAAAYLYNFTLLGVMWLGARHISWQFRLFEQWSIGVLIVLIVAWLFAKPLQSLVRIREDVIISRIKV